EQVKGHPKVVPAHKEREQGAAGEPVAAAGVIWTKAAPEERVHDAEQRRRGPMSGRGGDDLRRHRRAQEGRAVAQRVEERALEPELLTARKQAAPKGQLRAEMTEQEIEIVEIAQSAFELPLIEEVGCAVQDHVLGCQYRVARKLC